MVYGPRPPAGEAMTRVLATGSCSPRRDRLPVGIGLPAETARHDTRAACSSRNCSSRSCPSQRKPERPRQRRPHPAARYASARAHRPTVLYQQPSGELTEDPVWRWSSAPDRYLDTALRLELASSPNCAWSMRPALQRWRRRFWSGTSSLKAGHDSSAQSSSSSRGPTAWSIHTWCEHASPCQASCQAIWPPLRGGCCGGSRRRFDARGTRTMTCTSTRHSCSISATPASS